MKNAVKLFLISILVSLSSQAFAQTADLLTTLPDSTRESFVKTEPQFINSVNWLEKTPVNVDKDRRTLQSALVLAWIINTPTLTVILNANVFPYTKKNPELIVTFLGGYAKYLIANSNVDSKDPMQVHKGNIAGTKSVIAFYQAGNGLKKDKKIEKIIELDKNGGLEAWVKEQLVKE